MRDRALVRKCGFGILGDRWQEGVSGCWKIGGYCYIKGYCFVWGHWCAEGYCFVKETTAFKSAALLGCQYAAMGLCRLGLQGWLLGHCDVFD